MHTSVERRSDPSFSNGDHKVAQRSLSSRVDVVRSLEPGVVREGWRLLTVFLTGGAPWGFTLKGGLEYHEPLIITKVEEGGRAWAVRLQVGDEVMTVNEFPLSGYRQEAIGLIKGSHKTLALGVKRKTETANRPHSWHATKFEEAQQYALQRQVEDPAISHHASFSTEDLSSNWDQTNLQRVSHQFSSLGSMDSLENCLEPYNPGGLSRAERSGSSEYLGGAKRDSAYSSFSTGCGTPDYTLFTGNTASSENMPSKVGGWDSHNWSSVDEKQGTRQVGGRDSPHHSGSTTGGRSNIGPVWHVPEKKQTASPFPPLPPVPLRSDSFGAVVHGQKGIISYGEGPNASAEQRAPRQSRGGDGPLNNVSRGHQADDGGSSVRLGYNLTSKNEEGFPPHSQLNVHPSMGLPGHSHNLGHIDDSHPSRRASVPATLGLRDPGGCHGNIQEYRKGDVGWGGAVDVGHLAKETKESAKKAKTQKALHRSTHPPSQWAYPNDQDSIRYARPEESPLVRVSNDPNERNSRQGQGRDDECKAESRYINYPFGKPEGEPQAPPPREVPQDLRLSKEDLPSQHSMGQEAGILQDPCLPDLQTEKQGVESDRFATILRNEILQRKNRLQKSRSSTGLTGSAPAAEDAVTTPASRETSTASSDGSFSNTYKDNLKEVQARVLHATSFSRRDLEPDTSTQSPPAAVVSRIGSRKRIPPEKKLRSFSEPNKLHEVGVVEPEPPVSLADRRKVFELSGKPVFQKPLPRQGAMQGSSEMPSRSWKKGGVGGGTNTSRGLPEGQQASVRQLQQRLESFGQYEPSWNVPRKPSEARVAGRSHSAENILDPSLEELSQSSWIHERSRSSPSADLYGQNIPVSGKNYDELSYPDPRIGELKHRELGGRWSPAPMDHLPEPSPGAAGRHHRENRGTAPRLDQGDPHHRHDKPIPPNSQAPPPYPSSQLRRGSAPVEAGLGDQRAQSELRVERRWRSEGVPSSSPLYDPELEDSQRASRGPEKSQRDPPSLLPAANSSSSPMDGQYPPALRLGAQGPADQPPTSAHHDAPCSSGWSKSSSRAVWKAPVPAPARSAHQAEGGPGYDHTHSGAPQATNGISPEEELRRTDLALDIAGSDRSLAGNVDSSGMRSTMDLTEGTYPQGGAALEGRKPGSQQAPQSTLSSQERHTEDSTAAAGSLTNISSFSTSAPVAEPLMKTKDVAGSHSKEEQDIDLALKKHQLIDSLTQKLQALREMREGLLQEVRSNDALGEEVECSVEQVCRPNELGKFRMFVGDLDKVVSLQLSLSGRLARVQSSIDKLPRDCQLQEKRTLLEKRDQLLRQQEDAEELKENLDRRERLVSDILTSQLSEKHLAEFRHFVKTKAALIVERRKLDDKIKLGEEQLKSLTDNLLPDQRPPL